LSSPRVWLVVSYFLLLVIIDVFLMCLEFFTASEFCSETPSDANSSK